MSEALKDNKRDASSCSCWRCVQACKDNPGWMTPEEASAAMEARLAHRLMRDWLEPCGEVGNNDRIYVLAPASEGCEGEDAPEGGIDLLAEIFGGDAWTKGRCMSSPVWCLARRPSLGDLRNVNGPEEVSPLLRHRLT